MKKYKSHCAPPPSECMTKKKNKPHQKKKELWQKLQLELLNTTVLEGDLGTGTEDESKTDNILDIPGKSDCDSSESDADFFQDKMFDDEPGILDPSLTTAPGFQTAMDALSSLMVMKPL